MAKDIGYLGGRELKKELGVEQHSEDRKTLGVIGRVGVGTTTFTPNYTMEVRGDFKPGELVDSDDNRGTLGLYLSKDAGGIKWVQPEPTGLGAIFVTEDDQILGVSSYVGINFRGGDFVSISTNTSNDTFVDIDFSQSDSKEWVDYSTVGIFTTKFVGIGSTQPDTPLDVIGDANITGILTAGGFVGPLTGNVVGNLTGLAQTASFATTAFGLQGEPDLMVGVVTSNNAYYIDTNEVLNGTTLGSGVTQSSLTDLGILNSLQVNGDATFYGTSYDMIWDASANSLEFGDNARAVFGASSDLRIYHSGSHSYIDDQGNGDLYIRGGSNIRITKTSNEPMALFANDGSAYLYYNGSFKFQTTNTGVNIAGEMVSDGADIDGDVDISGITTSTGGFVGDLTGTATTATNLADAANITTGTIDRARLSGDYDIGITGFAQTAGYATTAFTLDGKLEQELVVSFASSSSYATTAFYLNDKIESELNVAVAETAGYATTAFDLARDSYGIDITGTATTATNLANAANITTGTISRDRLTGDYDIGITGLAQTASFATTAFTLDGKIEADLNVASATTASAATTSYFLNDASGILDGRIDNARLSGEYDIDISGNAATVSFASTAAFATTSYGLDGTPNITIGNLIGVGASFSGNVTIGGTLTYEDVNNIDSVGFITARSGLHVGIPFTGVGATILPTGTASFAGVVTAAQFVGDLAGTATTANNLSDAANITTGTINRSRLSGDYDIGITGLAQTASFATTAFTLNGVVEADLNVAYADTAGYATTAFDLVGSSFTIDIIGTATTANNLSDAANITTGTIDRARLSGDYDIGITGFARTSGYATTSFGLDGRPDINVGNVDATGQITALSADIDTTITTTDLTVYGTATVDGNIDITGANRVINFYSDLANIDYKTGIHFHEGNPSTDARMKIDYNAEDELPSNGQIEIFGYNLGGTSAPPGLPLNENMLVVFNRYGEVGVGSTRPSAFLDVAGDPTRPSAVFNHYVGIGLTQPTTHLDVIGNAKFTGVVTATTFIGDLTGTATTATLADTATVAQGLTGTPNIVVGVVTATTFIGDGSGITGVTAEGSGIGVRDNDVTVGTAQTINFGTNLSVTPVSSGIVTITATGGNTGAAGTWAVTSVGIHTTKNVGVGTTNPQTTLQVERFGVQTGFGTFTAIAGIAHTIDSYVITDTDFKTAEYTLFFEYNNNIQSEKVLIMQNGTTAYAQEYAVMYNPNLILSATGTLDGTTCNLEVTPDTGINGVTTYRFARQTIL
ncbi:flagellar hook-length control protein [Synechococcus phage S-T4]|uniref:Flagellar hook-length control protein n=1 Tax=Synechococcus phage S-T4 TaxID=2268578 RepID=A0A385EF19_9CAUD|nr:flagellar hook-length control protein [Synechococcus phage S-T4]AXQ70471.1 flagellar hook-length control protein [Synechococcus phage S-T4]